MVISSTKTISLSFSHFICMMCPLFFFLFLSNVYASTKAVNKVSLQVVNTFTWTTALADISNYCQEAWIYITNNIIIPLTLSASTSSTYEILANDVIVWVSGAWVWNYIQNETVILSWWDGLKEIQSHYIAWNEYLRAEPLFIYKDTMSPTASLPLQPFLWSKENWSSVTFERSASNDIVSSIVQYTLHISDNPSFIWETTFDTSSLLLNVSKNLLPTWTIYRYVSSKDCIWNTIDGVSSFFTTQIPNQTNWWEIPKTKTYHVDNVSLKWYTTEVDIVCQWDIWWYVYAEDPENITVDIQISWSWISHTFSPNVSAEWYYALPIEYINALDNYYIAPWNYTVNVHTSHPTIWDKTFTYENLLITDTCRETSIKNNDISSETIDNQENSTRSIIWEHTSAESYTKNNFDVRKIRQQNSLILLQQLQRNDKNETLTLSEQDALHALLQYPDLLQRTWADPRDIIKELYILEKLTTNKENKYYLQQLIHLIQPGRYPWMILLLLFLCYDIDIYNKRAYLYTKNNKKWKK